MTNRNLEMRKRAAKQSAGIDLDALVIMLRKRLASLWTDPRYIVSQEALDKRGARDAGEILRAIKTPVSWLQMPLPAWLRS